MPETPSGTPSGEQRAITNAIDNLDFRLRQQRDLIIAHDHVHPDRNDCGGVGGCLMLMAEADVEEKIQDILTGSYRQGWKVTVAVTRV